MLCHSPCKRVATGKFGSKQRQRPIQKHSGRRLIDRKTASHLSDPQYLSKCDPPSCERVIKTRQTSLRWNKELQPVRDVSPSMLLYGTLSLFRTNFPRCHALLWFVTSSLSRAVCITSLYPKFNGSYHQALSIKRQNLVSEGPFASISTWTWFCCVRSWRRKILLSGSPTTDVVVKE